MQICEAEVRLNGSAAHTVIRRNVTPAEFLILERINGAGSVVCIRVTGEAPRTKDDEFERLSRHYGAEAVQAAFPEGTPPNRFPGEEPAKRKERKTSKQRKDRSAAKNI